MAGCLETHFHLSNSILSTALYRISSVVDRLQNVPDSAFTDELKMIYLRLNREDFGLVDYGGRQVHLPLLLARM